MRWLLALLVVPTFAHAQIHKCVVDGRVVYQESPCAGAGGKVSVTPTQGVEAPRAPPPEPQAAKPLRQPPVSDCVVVGQGPFIKCGVLK